MMHHPEPAMDSRAPRAVKLLILALLSMPCVARAESLVDAWAMALQSDGALAAARSDARAAEADQSAALRQRWPALDLNGTYTQFEHTPNLDIATPAGQLQAPIWRNNGYTIAGADVSVPLWTSGKISGAIGAAAAGARGANAQEVRSTAELKLAVAESYVAVFRFRRALDVAESNVSSLQAHADDVQAMYDKQTVAQSDVLAAQVALANATQQRLRATNGLHLATAAYNRWVGQPLGRAPDLDEPSPAPPAQRSETLEQLVAQAIERRPELTAAGAQQEALEQAARSERALGLPQIMLHAGYNHVDNQILDRENFASVGIGFQWRLFDSGQLQARTNALHSRARAAAQRLADLRSQVTLDVETAFYNREEAAARIHAASAAVAQAEENLRIARELYASGLGTNNQVLDAETLRIVTVTNRDDARFDALIAEYRLQRSTGAL
ncbi:MAG: TolC family protein [Steroidobacterales bacterium]